MIVHVYFAVRPEKLPITASMIVGSMSREFYLKEHDPERWVVETLPHTQRGVAIDGDQFGPVVTHRRVLRVLLAYAGKDSRAMRAAKPVDRFVNSWSAQSELDRHRGELRRGRRKDSNRQRGLPVFLAVLDRDARTRGRLSSSSCPTCHQLSTGRQPERLQPLRALLTDLFLVGEIVREQLQAASRINQPASQNLRNLTSATTPSGTK